MKNIRKDDLVETSDINNNKYRFKVSDIRVYPDAEFPTQEVFGSDIRLRLILITCAGVFDYYSNNYSDRTVVYADLVKWYEKNYK